MMRTKRTIFFSNPKVCSKKLLSPHIVHTVKRLKETDAKYILAIQDITVLNYSSHRAKTEIGRIGRTGKTDQYGLFQHSTLCVSDRNECLGLIDLQHFHNDDFETDTHHHDRPIEAKKTMCWINALRNMRNHLAGVEKPIITVADREGDFFEFLHELMQHKESFVIRSKHNRHTGEKHHVRGDKISDLFKKQIDIGEMEVRLNDVRTHEIKTINLRVQCLQAVNLPAPERGKKGRQVKDYSPITVNIVKAYNETYSWLILTDLPVNTLEECKVVLQIYKERWHIEDYHKILKTAYQIDELYLHASRAAIENALTMISISACRLYWLIYVSRVDKVAKANSVFKDYEWKAIYIYFKEKIPPEPPPLSDVILQIARLGGYKHKKNATPPGIKTMWIGFQSFNVAAEMYNSILSTKT
jgi:hypothetical protein